jgi:replicative DNA helicase
VSVIDNIKGSLLLNDLTIDLEIKCLKESDFVKFNHNHNYFYVCHYVDEDEPEDE